MFAKQKNRSQPSFETLEDRVVPSVSFSPNYLIDRHDIGGVGETPLVGDFNGDGLADIVDYIPNGSKDARWVVKFNQGNGQFKDGARYDIDRHDIGGVGETPLVGDFNGDGLADIVDYIPNGGKDARWVVKFNQGNGRFKDGARYDIDRHDIGGVGETPLVGDFNGDGLADIGVAIPNGTKDARWVVKFNQGNGQFKDGARYDIDRHDIGGVGETALVGDFNGDRLADIVDYIPNGSKDARWVVKFNQGNGRFNDGARYDIDRHDIGGVGETPLVGDFNGDHRADIGVNVPNGTKDARWVVKLNQQVADPLLTRAPAYANVVNGVLQIVGDSGPNHATVFQYGNNVYVEIESTPSNDFSLTPTVVDKVFSANSIREVRFWGYEGDDTLNYFVNLPSTYLDGGTGNDAVYFSKAGEHACRNMESIQIWVPTGNPQGNANDCGPNSAWRVLQSYGGTVTEQQLLSYTYRSSVISAWNLGTTGQTLTEAMNANRRGVGSKTFAMATGQNVDNVIEQLKRGHPVVALIGWQDSSRAVEGSVGQVIEAIIGEDKNRVPTGKPVLHWIAVTGCDLAKREIYYTDTDGKPYQMSINDFNHTLRWSFDDVSQRTLRGLGVVPGTIIY